MLKILKQKVTALLASYLKHLIMSSDSANPSNGIAEPISNENLNPIQTEGDNQMVSDSQPNGLQDTQSENHSSPIVVSHSESSSSITFHESSQTLAPLPQHRPIEASDLRLSGTYSAVGGNRPIEATTFEIVRTISSSGMRPIGANPLKISQLYSVMGNRPVASNESDETGELMGYID